MVFGSKSWSSPITRLIREIWVRICVADRCGACGGEGGRSAIDYRVFGLNLPHPNMYGHDCLVLTPTGTQRRDTANFDRDSSTASIFARHRRTRRRGLKPAPPVWTKTLPLRDSYPEPRGRNRGATRCELKSKAEETPQGS
jgi:hypothetical protein